MTLEPSGLGPSGVVAMLAAMLRADRADVASYARVLTSTLADALPEGMVEVEQRRGLGDRVAGRNGRIIAIVVHGVVISRRTVGIDEWLQALAEDLTRIAARDAAARAAL